MDIDKLVHYLGQNNLKDSEACYLSDFVLDLQDDLEKALNDVSRLKVEHRLSYEEADRLFVKNEEAQNKIDSIKSKLELSQKQLEDQLGEIKMLKKENKKYADEVSSLQSRLSISAVHTSSLNLKLELHDSKKAEEIDLLQKSIKEMQNTNSDIVKKSEEKTKTIRKEQKLAQDFAANLQCKLEKSLIEQKRLLHHIQKLEIEVFDANFEGFSTLFEPECPEPNLEKIDSIPNQIPKETCLPVQHFRAFSQHEQLVSSVMESIDKHYRNRGFGKYFRYVENNFPGTCCIL